MQNFSELPARYSNIEKLAQLGYWEWFPQNGYTFFSNGLKQIFSFISSEISPSKLVGYLKKTGNENQHTLLIDYIRRVQSGNYVGLQQFSLIMPDNDTRYFEVNSMRVEQENDYYIAGTVREVTNQVKYTIVKEKEVGFEKMIAEIAARFMQEPDFDIALVNTLSDLGHIYKADNVYLFRIDNNQVSQQFQWIKSGSGQYQRFTENLPPKEIKYLIELLKEHRTIYFNSPGEFPDMVVETKKLLFNAEVKSILLSGLQSEKQTVGALVLTRNNRLQKWDFSDIHMIKMSGLILSHAIRQHTIQKKLTESENRLQFALLAGNLGTWEFDCQTQTYFFDERYANIFGFSVISLNGRPDWFKNHIHPDDRKMYQATFDECTMGNSNYYALEYRIQTKDGLYKWVSDWGLVTKIMNEGKAQRMVGVIQDISKKKTIEVELINAKEKAEESEKLKTAFLANVSHEIRTPMNGITGFAELLYNDLVAENEKQQYFEIIWKNSTRLLTLINNIIDISKLETGQIKLFEHQCCLNELFEDISRIYSSMLPADNSIRLTIHKELDEDGSCILVDDSRLKQVLGNLIGNAIKFTNHGFIEIGYQLNADKQLEFYVRDTGEGMNKAHNQHIFSRFSRSVQTIELNKEGTGLGLPISKGLIELMGGKIWFKSVKGIGSTFRFTIPYKPIEIKIENMG